jgi:hypothetical protein
MEYASETPSATTSVPKTGVILPSQFDVTNVTFSTTVKHLSNGAKVCYVNYTPKDSSQNLLVMQTDETIIPFGMNDYDGNWSLSFSMRDGAFRTAMEAFDEKVKNAACGSHCMAWFNKESMSAEVCEALYAPIMKVGKSEYPPTMRVKIPKKDDVCQTAFYNENRERITTDPEELLAKGTVVRGLVQCMGVWFAGSKFGVSWKLLQLVVKQKTTFNNYSFIDDDFQEKKEEEEEEEEDEEEEEEEEE